ncbi:hypothetical protein M2103_001326 [Ereboglobus sp. PH5-5]|uniref:hypothetical protein n=1 Tax=Ereboglobus sp. PH5-5 TaxID=2940529 RepID=UPI0024060826|nr:hypothetical protein [Ereboglobus sp. PH5-5]MDF9833104.1 hypothetical protein [Ereboglobus sp. PH5-5]
MSKDSLPLIPRPCLVMRLLRFVKNNFVKSPKKAIANKVHKKEAKQEGTGCYKISARMILAPKKHKKTRVSLAKKTA